MILGIEDRRKCIVTHKNNNIIFLTNNIVVVSRTRARTIIILILLTMILSSFQFASLALGFLNDALRQTGELRDGDAETSVARPRLDLVQKLDELVAVRLCRDVDVAEPTARRRFNVGHFVEVRREEQHRLLDEDDLLGDGPREAEAIEGRRAAPQLVHDDEAPVRRGREHGARL